MLRLERELRRLEDRVKKLEEIRRDSKALKLLGLFLILSSLLGGWIYHQTSKIQTNLENQPMQVQDK